jgi:hypothetical protein
MNTSTPSAGATPADFDFLLGHWQVQHQRLKERLAGCSEWAVFDGQVSNHQVMGGLANIDDTVLNLPEGSYRALAMRAYDTAQKRWSIWWLDGRLPSQLDVPVTGGFSGDVGSFYSDEHLRGVPIKVRFQWHVQNAARPRWEQAFSADGGLSWEVNWIMQFTRQPAV